MKESFNNRDRFWEQADQPWDLVIVGGGITGAGILREATRLGLRVLLVEKRDFAWGTSSRSSKLVHGGLRYLKEGKLHLTQTLVQQREQLILEAPGLIERLGFLTAVYNNEFPGKWGFGLVLSVYDLLALQWSHKYHEPHDFHLLAPSIPMDRMSGGYTYGDAQTDDARLVFRLIRESVRNGGWAMNYVTADELLLDDSGTVCGLRIRDTLGGRTAELYSSVVINATGPWADFLRKQVGASPRIRPLRGSHLIFPSWRIPVAQAICFWHPIDGRPVFVIPWEGATIIGTTDMDCDSLEEEPGISPAEVAYLMTAIEYGLPSYNIGLNDVISAYAGVRPVIGSGKLDPSKESRDHVLWNEHGLLTVAGGKLTSFALIAREAIHAVRRKLPHVPEPRNDIRLFDRVDDQLADVQELDPFFRRRLTGRYGREARPLVEAAAAGELESIPGALALWAETRWAARCEWVVRLEDLMLRRVRLGLLLPEGGERVLPRLRKICQPELGWDDARWEAEQSDYLELWNRCYSLSDRSSVPDWKSMLAGALRNRAVAEIRRHKIKTGAQLAAAGVALSSLGFLGYSYYRRHH